MKKTCNFLLAAGLFCISTVVWADNTQPTPGTDLRPSQKAMQARAGWMKEMNANLPAKKYEEVAKSAMALASQTEAAGKTHPNPVGKDLTLKVSSLATATAEAVGKKDGDTAKMKLTEIKAACDECHAKIRDKK